MLSTWQNVLWKKSCSCCTGMCAFFCIICVMSALVSEMHSFKLRLPLYSSRESRFSKMMLKIKQKSEFLNFSETNSGSVHQQSDNKTRWHILGTLSLFQPLIKTNICKSWSMFWKYVTVLWIKAEVKKDCLKAMQKRLKWIISKEEKYTFKCY